MLNNTFTQTRTQAAFQQESAGGRRQVLLNSTTTSFSSVTHRLKRERAKTDEDLVQMRCPESPKTNFSQKRLRAEESRFQGSSLKSKDDFTLGGTNIKGVYNPQSYIASKRSTRLIQNADHMQVGTMMYTQEDTKVSRKFIPIFPFLYDDLMSGRLITGGELYLPKPPAQAIPIYSDKKVLKHIPEESKGDEDDSGEGIPTKAHLRFTVNEDPLFQYEDSRADSQASHFKILMCKAEYIVELEIANMKSVHIEVEKIPVFYKQDKASTSRPVNIKVYIAMHRPCPVQKIYSNREQKPQDVRSPFRHPTDLFMNYWNLHQVYYLCGRSYQDLLDRFVDVIKKRNPLCKLSVDFEDAKQAGQASNSSKISNHMQNSIILPVRDLLRRSKLFQESLPKLRLPLMFSILAMLSQDKVNLFNNRLKDFMDYLIAMSDCNKSERNAQRAACAIDAMITNEILEYKSEPDIKFIKIFEKYYAEQLAEDNDAKFEDINFMKQRRLTITPTLDYYHPMVEDETCLVLRKYKDHINRFVRVSFNNEYFERGFYQQQLDGGRSLLLGFIHNIIRSGIVIFPSQKGTKDSAVSPGCVLRFISYSNSQIKQHSAWFFVGPQIMSDIPKVLNEQEIIDSCGDFSREKNILKKYARRGQCFSTAKFVTMIHPDQLVINYPDIKRNGYCFTDGTGHISSRLAEFISKDYFGLGYTCSAFQIRIGGAKGVLMVDKRLDKPANSELGPIEIRLRESQIKFPSNDLSLNVVRCATYSQGYLNRQLIMLLSCLGVPDHIFLNLQRKAKEMVQVSEIYKKLLVKTQKVFRSFKKINAKTGRELSELMHLNLGPSKWLQDSMKLALLTGYELQKDPMFSSILYTMQLSQTLSIKKKARILLEDSCVLIGVVDDRGILGPNEVYVQIRKESCGDGSAKSKKNQSSKFFDAFKEVMKDSEKISGGSKEISKILEGNILMSRNPCTHPGDIRMLTAVGSHPEFDHLVNVVVFPSTGDRPLCNMMSGGDLDGDVYFLCWDQAILASLRPQSMCPPAHYTKPDIIIEKPAEETIADYFTFYLERDCLGQLANLHLALSDQFGNRGPLQPECIQLSRLQSVAVDFAKHGECVPRDEFQHLLRMLEKWPDFFEKKNKVMRESKGILGQLYRELSNEKCYKDFMSNQYRYQVQVAWELDSRILSKAASPATLNSYLLPAFQEIVIPMQRGLRQLMFLFRQHTEAALFASDLKHSIANHTTDDALYGMRIIKGQPLGSSSKPDEALVILNLKLGQLLDKYRLQYQAMVSKWKDAGDLNAEINIAVAIYFSTYFHLKNASCKRYIAQIFKKSAREDCESLLSFIKAWEAHELSLASAVKPSTLAAFTGLCTSFQVFLDETKKVENSLMTHPNRLQRLLEVKRLFSIPWLLVSETLMDKQDFLKQVLAFKQANATAFLQKSFGSNGNECAENMPLPTSLLKSQSQVVQSSVKPMSARVKLDEDVEMKV